jgi:ketosteroid isomerase-like protein
MKRLILLCLIFCGQLSLTAQVISETDSLNLLVLNRQVDQNVVAQNIVSLEKIYAEDFVFSHGSGRVDGKVSWLKSVAKGGFIKRDHDSVTVELHGEVAILRGKLSVEKKNKDKTDRYWLRYVRVFKMKKEKWQMISHITTAEFHLPG